MRLTHLLSLALIAALFVACSDDDSTPNTPSTPEFLMPLAVGNVWVFDYNRFEGGQYTSTEVDSLIVFGTMTDNENNLWYLVDDRRANDTAMYRNSTTGLEINAGHGINIRLKYPAAKGDQEVFQTDEDLYYVTVLSTDTTVTTAAGIYKCIKYGLGDGEKEFRHLLVSPGTGLVGYDSPNTSSSLYYESRLRSVHFQN